jgi:hypothetical protein
MEKWNPKGPKLAEPVRITSAISCFFDSENRYKHEEGGLSGEMHDYAHGPQTDE